MKVPRGSVNRRGLLEAIPGGSRIAAHVSASFTSRHRRHLHHWKRFCTGEGRNKIPGLFRMDIIFEFSSGLCTERLVLALDLERASETRQEHNSRWFRLNCSFLFRLLVWFGVLVFSSVTSPTSPSWGLSSFSSCGSSSSNTSLCFVDELFSASTLVCEILVDVTRRQFPPFPSTCRCYSSNAFLRGEVVDSDELVPERSSSRR